MGEPLRTTLKNTVPELKDELAGLVLNSTEKVMRKSMDPKQQEKMVARTNP